MRLTALVFLSCLALAAQGQVVVSGPAGVPFSSTIPTVEQPPTRPEDLCTLEGSVFNAATGAPVKKAAVVMTRAEGAPNAPPASYSTTTDSAGKFAMKDIEPGKYRMTVTRNGFVTMIYGARGPNRPGTTITLERAQNMKDVSFRLTPHGVVAGRIVDEDGEPVPYVSVQLVRFQVRQGRQQLNMAGGSGTTNDLGEYRIFGIAPGKYYLRASGQQRSVSPFMALDRSASSQLDEDYVPTYYPGTIDTANAAAIDVGSGAQVSGINFTLLKSATVHVKGSVGSLPAGVQQRIQIMILPRGAPFIGGPLRPTFTDAKGNFDIRGVAPGQYMLSANINDGGRSYSTSVPVDVSNSNVENVRLEIGPGVDVAGKIRIEGDIKQDLTTVNVNLRPRETGGIVFGGVSPGRVKDDNTFLLQGVAANLFEVTLFGLPDGFYVKSIKSGQTDVLAAGLDVAKGAPQPLEVVLSPNAGSMSGAVQNPNTGRPAPGATVVLVPQEKERRDKAESYRITTTDQNGNYTMKSLVPGEYRVFAWEDIEPGAYLDPDFLKPLESKSEAVTIRESDQKTVALTMIPADAPSQSDSGQANPR